MSYDEEETVSDSEFNPNDEGLDLDDPLEDDLLDEPTDGFRFDEEEEPETV